MLFKLETAAEKILKIDMPYNCMVCQSNRLGIIHMALAYAIVLRMSIT